MKMWMPRTLAGSYLAIVVLACVPVFTGADALSGIFAVLLASPWAQLFERLLPGAVTGTATTGITLVLIGGAINAALIYLLARWLTAKLFR